MGNNRLIQLLFAHYLNYTDNPGNERKKYVYGSNDGLPRSDNNQHESFYSLQQYVLIHPNPS